MFRIGDEVTTTKGCRIAGPPGILKVVETGKKWSDFDACICEKPDGTKRMFLVKNLRYAKDRLEVRQ